MAGFRTPSNGEEISVLPIIVSWFTHGISRASIQLDGEELLIFTPDTRELGLDEVNFRRSRDARIQPPDLRVRAGVCGRASACRDLMDTRTDTPTYMFIVATSVSQR